MSGQEWVADLPLPEARFLARVQLCDAAGNPMYGTITHDGNGRITLDGEALMSLSLMHEACGFGVEWRGDLPVLFAGRDEYALTAK